MDVSYYFKGRFSSDLQIICLDEQTIDRVCRLLDELGIVYKLGSECALILESNRSIRRIFRQFSDVDFEVKIQRFRKSKSQAQLRYYFGVIVPRIIQYKWETDGERWSKADVEAYNYMHILKLQFKEKYLNGKPVMIISGKTLSDMNVQEAEDFFKLVRHHWAEIGCDIKEPNEGNFLNDFINDNS